MIGRLFAALACLACLAGPASADVIRQDAPELVRGLPLWASPETVSAWLMSMPGIESTRMNPEDAKGRASMQVNAISRDDEPRIAGVRSRLWPIFVHGRLRGLRIVLQPKTDTSGNFCASEGLDAAQRLNAYLAEIFGPEQNGAYAGRGVRARLHHRTYEGPFQTITEVCDSLGEAAGVAQIEVFLIADGDNGFSDPQPDTIDVRRSRHSSGGPASVADPSS